jgi:hypothetical protein
VRVWDVATGQKLPPLKGHTGGVWGVAFSPDGKQLASASQDGTVKVWDAATGQILHTLEGHSGGVWGVAFSPDGRRLVSASGDQAHRHPGPFSPGRLSSAAIGDQTVKVCDTDTGQETLSLEGHKGSVFGVAFSADGRRLASASWDRTVRVWDAATRQKPLTLEGHKGPVFGVAFSPDGCRLASASLDGTVKVWDAMELTPQRLIECEARGLVQFLFEESPLPALPGVGASTVGLMASPLGPGPLLAASALIPGRTPLPGEVAAAVQRDPTITEAVRQQALAWAERFGRIKGRAKQPAW